MGSNLLEALEKVGLLAGRSKWERFCNQPIKYLTAIGHRLTFYKLRHKPLKRQAELFFGKKLTVALPAGTDIYLTGGKSHDSEIRLARFLINSLKPGDHMVDIGAHFGYFTLLAGELATNSGRVLAFEPGVKNFAILEENTTSATNIQVFPKAVSKQSGLLTFYEFPNLQSEYNTSDIRQYEYEDWFNHIRPFATSVESTTIDEVIKQSSVSPKIIKIDVEGGEAEVVIGGHHFLSHENPIVIMEYLHTNRNNKSHRQATIFMINLGYKIHTITPEGSLHQTNDIEAYLDEHQLDSDNVVFCKDDSA